MSDRVLASFDGIAVFIQGDLFLIHYGADARVHRTRWLFDRLDEHFLRHRGDVLGMMIIPAEVATPDAATRAENSVRMKKLMGMRRLVTVALGDAFKVSIVRTIMRTLVLIQGRAKDHFVVETEAQGIDRLLEARSASTPSRAEIEQMLAEMRRSSPLAA